MNRRDFVRAGVALGGLTACAAPGRLLAAEKKPIGAPIRLTDHTGRAVDTSRDFAGRPMLIYFGYTFCPDVCPTTLVTLANAVDAAIERQPSAEEIAFLFVTFDPARDTVELMRTYVGYFHPALIGLTGSEDEIQQVAKDWRAVRFIPEHEEGEPYAVHHPASSYLTDRDHRLADKIWFSTPAEETAEILLTVV